MKRRITALLLAGIMVLQGSGAIMADIPQNDNGNQEVWEKGQESEEIPGFSSGEKEEKTSKTENPAWTEEDFDEEIAPTFTDGVQQGAETEEESPFQDHMLGDGENEAAPQFVKDIDWSQTDEAYWNAIDWSEISWEGIMEVDESGLFLKPDGNGWDKIPKLDDQNAQRIEWDKINWSTFQWCSYDKNTFEPVYFDATKVDWSKVNWEAVDWKDSSIFDYTGDGADELWKNIDWSKINWSTFDWGMIWDESHLEKIEQSEKKNAEGKSGIEAIDWSAVDWYMMDGGALGFLLDEDALSYEIKFEDLEEENILITDIQEFPKADGNTTRTIDPEDVKLCIIPEGGTEIPIDSKYYRVTLNNKDGDADKYEINWIQWMNRDGKLKSTPLEINQEYAYITVKQEEKPLQPLGSSYWDLIIDDSKCTYANQDSRKPEVAIIGEEGERLEENVDYTYEVIEAEPCETRESKIKISTVKDSTKVAQSEITKRYTIHYADINQYYELKNVQSEITYLDSLKTGDLSLDLKTEYQVGEKSKLPLKESEEHLRVQFSYDGKTWIDVNDQNGGFGWSDWYRNENRTEEAVWIKVSIKGNDKYVGYYPNEIGGDGGMEPRYIDGEIIRKIPVKPYSLSEGKDYVYPTTYSTGNLEGTTKTELPTQKIRFNASQYFAVVNPAFEDEVFQEIGGKKHSIGYNTIKGNEIESVTYNGKEQTPMVNVEVCEYGNFSLGVDPNALWLYRKEEFSKPEYEYEVDYSDNINAGTAEMTFIFRENLTGSIKRSFQILPKDINANTVSIEAMDFVQDGKTHEPKLTVIDTEASRVLDETDYTVKVVSGSITESGTVTVEVSGKNQEDGSGTGNYFGTRTVTYQIHSTQTGGGGSVYIPGLGDAAHYEIALEPVTYNGQKQLPKVTVKNLSTQKYLEAGKDFKVEHAAGADNTNAGTGKVRITGLRVPGTVQRGFLIRPKKLDSSVTVQTTSAIHNGKPLFPEVLVTDTERKAVLAEEKEYSLYAKAGSDNVNVGSGQIVVRGNGNYTGTRTVSFEIIQNIDEDGNIHNADGSVQMPDGTYLSPAKTMINWVKMVGNRVDIRLNSHANGAEGYDFVIGTSKDMLKTKDYVKVNKNQLSLQTSMYYVENGTYYAACHAWMKDKNGRKVFGPWSELVEFQVKAVMPQTPQITDVKVKGCTVTVSYTKCANAAGYDLVLGTQARKVNGELRPVQYGNLVKKVTDKNKVSVTFSDVKSGVYYVGVHAYNRTSENKKKVFSPWSKVKEIRVK